MPAGTAPRRLPPRPLPREVVVNDRRNDEEQALRDAEQDATDQLIVVLVGDIAALRKEVGRGKVVHENVVDHALNREVNADDGEDNHDGHAARTSRNPQREPRKEQRHKKREAKDVARVGKPALAGKQPKDDLIVQQKQREEQKPFPFSENVGSLLAQAVRTVLLCAVVLRPRAFRTVLLFKDTGGFLPQAFPPAPVFGSVVSFLIGPFEPLPGLGDTGFFLFPKLSFFQILSIIRFVKFRHMVIFYASPKIQASSMIFM